MAWASRFPEDSKSFISKRIFYYYYYYWAQWLWITDSSWVSIYTIRACLTLECSRIILACYLTLILGTLTWSTQLTKSITFPKAMTQKYNMVYIFFRNMPRTNTVVSIFWVWPRFSRNVIIIIWLMAKWPIFILDDSMFGSPRVQQCSRGYELSLIPLFYVSRSSRAVSFPLFSSWSELWWIY